jgi:hypothetical protein
MPPFAFSVPLSRASLLLASALCAPWAQADTLLASSPSGGTLSVALEPGRMAIGFQFTTDASGYALDTLTFRVFDPAPGAQTHQIEVALAEFSNLPGRQTQSFEATLLGNTVATADSLTVSLGGWTLEPSTRYVMGFYAPTGVQVVVGNQRISNLVLAPGWTGGPTVREAFDGSGNVLELLTLVNTFYIQYPAVTLTGEAVAPIPEPATAWLALAGLGTLGWRLRNARRRVS